MLEGIGARLEEALLADVGEHIRAPQPQQDGQRQVRPSLHRCHSSGVHVLSPAAAATPDSEGLGVPTTPKACRCERRTCNVYRWAATSMSAGVPPPSALILRQHSRCTSLGEPAAPDVLAEQLPARWRSRMGPL